MPHTDIFGDDPHFRRMSDAIAKLPAKPGLEAIMLGAGDVVTFSRNKVTGDRSYTRSAWRVMAHNGYQLQLAWAGGEKPFYAEDGIVVLMDEHDFYDGHAFVGGEA